MGPTCKVAPRTIIQEGRERAAKGMDSGLSIGSGAALGAGRSMMGTTPTGSSGTQGLTLTPADP